MNRNFNGIMTSILNTAIDEDTELMKTDFLECNVDKQELKFE